MHPEVSPDLLCKEAAGHVSCAHQAVLRHTQSAENGGVKDCSQHPVCEGSKLALAPWLYAGLSS